jgi:hypothetical protein
MTLVRVLLADGINEKGSYQQGASHQQDPPYGEMNLMCFVRILEGIYAEAEHCRESAPRIHCAV